MSKTITGNFIVLFFLTFIGLDLYWNGLTTSNTIVSSIPLAFIAWKLFVGKIFQAQLDNGSIWQLSGYFILLVLFIALLVAAERVPEFSSLDRLTITQYLLVTASITSAYMSLVMVIKHSLSVNGRAA